MKYIFKFYTIIMFGIGGIAGVVFAPLVFGFRVGVHAYAKRVEGTE